MERSDTGRADDPLIGRVLDGRYQVGEKVARGGMATVYQAHDLRLDRTVAIKIMHSGLADDPEFVARFEREARSAARLSHHNVVAVFDQGDDAGTLFLVMEYVPGLTLRDTIRAEAPMDAGKALALIEPVLAALAAAHGAGMIHRDVKPENVLMAHDGRVKVADFGLARAINSETQHTATGGVLIGTVSYLSPELVVDGKADARSDVYAVGVLIYEMLTGEKPHQADSPIQVAYKHVHEDVPPPSLRIPGVPAYVDALVARATARDRDLRPSDARMLLHQVRRVRQALDHGVVDDPDLVADLQPNRRRDDSVPTGELPGTVQPADEVYGAEIDMTAPIAWPEPSQPVVRPTPVTPLPPPPGRPPVVAAEPGRPARPRRSRRGLWLLVGLLVTALLVGVGAWQLGRSTTVPSLIGMNQVDATAKLKKAGLKLTLGKPEFSDTRPAGVVLRTDPGPGGQVSQGGAVTVVMSRGPDIRTVPASRGKTLPEVKALLTAAGLVPDDDVTYQYDRTIPNGRVISTNPAAKELLKRGTAVSIVVSKGRRPITIPDLTGRSGSGAAQRLTELGFKVTTTEEFSDTVAKGKVISQNPANGTGFRGNAIALVVSKGRDLVTVPKVKGSRTDSATQKLRDAGFEVVVKQSILYVGAGIVVGENPSAGSKAPRGSTVTITIV
ncbi:MAG: protein kinase [Marmoricola sp.]|nr:protein kinase [Marmoricola sp.]